MHVCQQFKWRGDFPKNTTDSMTALAVLAKVVILQETTYCTAIHVILLGTCNAWTHPWTMYRLETGLAKYAFKKFGDEWRASNQPI